MHVGDAIKAILAIAGHAELKQQLAAAREALQVAEANAARYLWLRQPGFRSNRYPHIAQYPRQSHDREVIPQIFDLDGYHPELLDACIDAHIATLQRDRQP